MGLEPRQNATADASAGQAGEAAARRLSWRALWALLRETYNEWDRDNASTLAAALAYYTAFAMAPVIVLAVAIAGFVLERREVRDEALRQVTLMMGPQGAELVRSVVDNVSRPGASLVATVASVATMVVSATGVFGELQRSLDIVWNVPPSPGSGLRQALRERVTAFVVVLAVGALLLASLLANAALEAMGKRLEWLPGSGLAARVLGYSLSVALVAALFAIVFKVLPRASVRWRDVWVGAAATAALFTAGRAALSVYFAHSALSSTYGAAGSLAALLAWLYYSANVFFFGAEFTQVYARTFGSQIRYGAGAPAAGSGPGTPAGGSGSGPGVALPAR